MAASDLEHESRNKFRDILSSVMGSAVTYGLLVSNPVENVACQRSDMAGKPPNLYPTHFDERVKAVAESYDEAMSFASG